MNSMSLMMLTRVLLLFSFALLLPARANLGETVPQVVKRYGSPTGYAEASAKSPFGRILFRAGGYELVLFLLNSKEVGARVSKLDKTAFNDAEMKTIMSAEEGGSAWTATKSAGPTILQWSRGDGATALYDKATHMLIFTSVEMAQALHAQEETPAANPPGTQATPSAAGQ